MMVMSVKSLEFVGVDDANELWFGISVLFGNGNGGDAVTEGVAV